MRTFLFLALCACGPDPVETDTTSGNTYSSDWAGMESMYVDHCDVCHPSISGIDLHDSTAFYVVAGDASTSTLWLDVTGASLNPMPQGEGALLPLEDVAHVEEWINNGAVID